MNKIIFYLCPLYQPILIEFFLMKRYFLLIKHLKLIDIDHKKIWLLPYMSLYALYTLTQHRPIIRTCG